MLCKADSVGVFQVESRAQMSMLPRLKPRNYYDLVVEVAIVRPGPIQGGMVHPYLKNREIQRTKDIAYPSESCRSILERTRGVPLFQEQAMQIAIDCAGFPPAKADKLRRAMATFRRAGTIHKLKDDFIERHGRQRATSANSPSAASSRSRASASTASPRAMPRASRSWSTPRRG